MIIKKDNSRDCYLLDNISSLSSNNTRENSLQHQGENKSLAGDNNTKHNAMECRRDYEHSSQLQKAKSRWLSIVIKKLIDKVY